VNAADLVPAQPQPPAAAVAVIDGTVGGHDRDTLGLDLGGELPLTGRQHRSRDRRNITAVIPAPQPASHQTSRPDCGATRQPRRSGHFRLCHHRRHSVAHDPTPGHVVTMRPQAPAGP
jgi:hypothetical protein